MRRRPLSLSVYAWPVLLALVFFTEAAISREYPSDDFKEVHARLATFSFDNYIDNYADDYHGESSDLKDAMRQYMIALHELILFEGEPHWEKYKAVSVVRAESCLWSVWPNEAGRRLQEGHFFLLDLMSRVVGAERDLWWVYAMINDRNDMNTLRYENLASSEHCNFETH